MKKVLLISYYWYPWNTSGSFRWLHISEYLNIHTVLTAKPSSKAFLDETMPRGKAKIILKLFKIPAALWGVIITPIVLAMSLFYDKVIFTIPPEMLLLPAWLCELLGKDVYVDVRDKIDRPTQPLKKVVPFYHWLYQNIKNSCVTMHYFDVSKPIIRHGYDDITKLPEEQCDNPAIYDKFYIRKRLSYKKYCEMLARGGVRVYEGNFKHYTSSSVITLRHLDNRIIGKSNLHKELFEFEPESWKQISNQMKEFLNI